MEALIRIVSQEMGKVNSGNRLSIQGTPTSASSTFQNDEIGLSVDIFNSNHPDREGSPSSNGAAEVASYHSGQSTPSQTYAYPTPQSYGQLSSYPQLPPSRFYPSSPSSRMAGHSFDFFGRPLPNMQNSSLPEKPEGAPFTHAYGPSPYGPAPYGSAPYGSAPYGPSPYGPSPYGPAPYGPAPYGPAIGSPGEMASGTVQGRMFSPSAGNEYDGQASLEMLQLIAKHAQRTQEEMTSSQHRPATPASPPSAIPTQYSTHQRGQTSLPDLPAITLPQPVSTSFSPTTQPRYSPIARHAHHLSQDGIVFQSPGPSKMINSCSTNPLLVKKEEQDQQQQGVKMETEMEMEEKGERNGEEEEQQQGIDEIVFSEGGGHSLSPLTPSSVITNPCAFSSPTPTPSAVSLSPIPPPSNSTSASASTSALTSSIKQEQGEQYRRFPIPGL